MAAWRRKTKNIYDIKLISIQNYYFSISPSKSGQKPSRTSTEEANDGPGLDNFS